MHKVSYQLTQHKQKNCKYVLTCELTLPPPKKNTPHCHPLLQTTWPTLESSNQLSSIDSFCQIRATYQVTFWGQVNFRSARLFQKLSKDFWINRLTVNQPKHICIAPMHHYAVNKPRSNNVAFIERVGMAQKSVSILLVTRILMWILDKQSVFYTISRQ